MKRKAFQSTLLLFVFILFSCVGFAQSGIPTQSREGVNKISNNVTANTNSTMAFERDIAILNGNHNEYVNFCNSYQRGAKNDTIPMKLQRIWLLYAYILAEQYHDTLAAFDFARIIEDSVREIDSVLASRIIKYYEMSSQMKPDPVSFLAAHRLYVIFERGLYGIAQDKEKAKFYDNLSDSIAKSINSQTK